MRNSLIIFALLTLIVKSSGNAVASNKLKADCKINLCNCTEIPDTHKSFEFRVVCKGNGTQEIILDDEIFKNESTPNWSRKIYVRMENFLSLAVDNVFFTRWQAYTSSSFDIWSCQKSFFSSDAPAIPQNKAQLNVFAGIGVIDSNIHAFPPMIFRQRNEVGLKLVRSQLTYLDVVSLGASKVNYLTIIDSIIGKIGGSPNEDITLAYSLKLFDAKVVIQDAKIGIIATGGLTFKVHESRIATVVLKRSTVGILEEGSISLGPKVSMRIIGSTIGFIPANAISIKESGKLTIKRSILKVKKSALINITCNTDIEISNNILVPDDMFKNCSVDVLNNSTNCEKINDFMDQSCGNNHLWSFEEEKEENGDPVTTTVAIPTSNTTTAFVTTIIPKVENTTEEIYDANLPKAQQLQHNGVPMGLFYLTIGLCLALLVMVMVLTAMVAWGKVPKKTNEPKDERRNSGCCDDYDEPSAAYFVTKTPLPLSMRRYSEDETNKDCHYYEN